MHKPSRLYITAAEGLLWSLSRTPTHHGHKSVQPLRALPSIEYTNTTNQYIQSVVYHLFQFEGKDLVFLCEIHAKKLVLTHEAHALLVAVLFKL